MIRQKGVFALDMTILYKQEITKLSNNTKADLIQIYLYIRDRFSKLYMISFKRRHYAVARTVVIKATLSKKCEIQHNLLLVRSSIVLLLRAVTV